VDPDGREAWDSPNEWNDDYIQKYNNTLNDRINQYKSDGKTFTCEDLVLSTLIDFASENGLPASFSNESGNYDSRDNKWKNVNQFKKAVLSTSGAKDLMNSTVTIDASQLKVGDIILMGDPMGFGNDEGIIGHAQIIVSKIGDFFGIRQGNTEGGFGSGRYGSKLYGGVPVEGRAFNQKTDTFYDRLQNAHSGATKAYGMHFRRWNLGGM
jgi:hypothetical protein